MPELTSFPPIVFEDDHILVINKPAGLIVQVSHTHDQPTLEEMLPTDTPGLDRGGIVHRLDKDTSGLMVIAKTPEAQAALQAQFKDREINKKYQTLVWGKFPDQHATINAPIARHPVLGHKFVVMEGGREAVTEIFRQHIFRVGTDYQSLLTVDIHTGRTHQIRVHLHALGYPVVGDPVYGRRKDPKKIRLFLHAFSLEFDHPITGEPLSFTIPLADDLAGYLSTLTPAAE